MAENDDEWMDPPAAPRLSPDTAFRGLDATVGDFWSFAMSDLRMNNVRGYVAEFLVREAVGASHARVEWDSFDVLAPGGCRIEVKSSAYVQSWAQRRPSRIAFAGLKARTWSPQSGYSSEADYNADVYVFALQTATTHAEYDPLDVAQWSFWVLKASTLRALKARSLGLAAIHNLTPTVQFQDLQQAILSAWTAL